MDKLILIDGNSIMNRAFYGIMGSKMLMTKDGKYTNAVYGFLAIIFKVIEELDPGYIAVAFDLKAPTARHKTYEGYKANRKGMPNELAEQMPIIKEILKHMNITIIEKEGYEADDLIYNMIQRIKEEDTTTPIDVITNDADLLPLVDDQVSVFIRGTRQFAEQGCPERRLYYQVTPTSWGDYLSYSSAYKSYKIPYNSMLLFKMIRGDKSDNIAPACKGYGGKKYTALMEKMMEDGVDFPNIFRYGNDFDEVMKPVLSKYFTEEEVENMKFIYGGICLRKLPSDKRLSMPKQIDKGFLQQALEVVKINLR